MSGFMSKKADKPTPGDTPDAMVESEDAADQASEPQGEPANEPASGAKPAAKDAKAGAQGGEQATPEEQQAYDNVVHAAMAVIYDDKSRPGIIQALQQGSTPDAALADVTASIMSQIDKQSQGKVPETVIIPASMEILSELAAMATKAGVMQVDDAMAQAAAQQVILKLAQEYGINQQDVQAMIAKLDPKEVQKMVGQQQQIAQSWAGDQAAPQGPADQQAPPDQAPGMMQQPQGAPA